MAATFPYPSMRGSFDLRFYFVVGPDDCAGRTLLDVVAKALDGGASFIQLRAKHADVAQIVLMAEGIAHEIRGHHLEDSVAFVIDDRVDAALEARHRGEYSAGLDANRATELVYSQFEAAILRLAVSGKAVISDLIEQTGELLTAFRAVPEGQTRN